MALNLKKQIRFVNKPDLLTKVFFVGFAKYILNTRICIYASTLFSCTIQLKRIENNRFLGRMAQQQIFLRRIKPEIQVASSWQKCVLVITNITLFRYSIIFFSKLGLHIFFGGLYLCNKIFFPIKDFRNSENSFSFYVFSHITYDGMQEIIFTIWCPLFNMLILTSGKTKVFPKFQILSTK